MHLKQPFGGAPFQEWRWRRKFTQSPAKHTTTKNGKSLFFPKSQQYIYHHEVEEECRRFSFILTKFSRVTSSTYC